MTKKSQILQKLEEAKKAKQLNETLIMTLEHELELKTMEHRFYFEQPVLVRNVAEDFWQPRRIQHINHDAVRPYRTTDAMLWRQCKPDPSRIITPNWIEHATGGQPVHDYILVVTLDGAGTTAIQLAKDVSIWDGNIKSYFVVPDTKLPQ